MSQTIPGRFSELRFPNDFIDIDFFGEASKLIQPEVWQNQIKIRGCHTAEPRKHDLIKVWDIYFQPTLIERYAT